MRFKINCILGLSLLESLSGMPKIKKKNVEELLEQLSVCMMVNALGPIIFFIIFDSYADLVVASSRCVRGLRARSVPMRMAPAITGTDETFAYFAIFLLLISVQRSDARACPRDRWP